MSEKNKEEKLEELPIAREGQRVSCKILKKEDDTFVAECKIAEKPKDEEECPGCAEAVAVGWALNYIKPYDEELADRLFREVTAEKISPDNAMDQCVGIAEQKGNKELLETLGHLKVIMHKSLAELEKEVVEKKEEIEK